MFSLKRAATIGLLPLSCLLALIGCITAPSLDAPIAIENPVPATSTPTLTPMTPEEGEQNAALEKQFRAKLAEYEEQLAPYKQTIPHGETFALRNLKDAPITLTNIFGEAFDTTVSRYVPWVGTLEATILDTMLYDSLEEAQALNELGVVLDSTPPECFNNPRLLVMRVRVTNVDATPGYSIDRPEEYFALQPFAPMFPYTDEAVGSYMDYLSGSLATFDGAPEGLDYQSPYINDFELAIGETRVLTAGWWVEGSVDPALIVARPSLSGSNPGPVIFELGLGGKDSST